MKVIDVILNSIIPVLIILHLLVAPYTKVEESFNLQATHDILRYGLPTNKTLQTLRQQYDHYSFPGPVPRTFLGAIILTILSKPLILITGAKNYQSQLIVRGVMGLLNALSLARYKNGLTQAYGEDTGKWFTMLIASQFHVIYYSSRTLPNMFAFCLTTLALRDFLPLQEKAAQNRQKRGIFVMILAAVVFRLEIIVFLLAQLLYMLVHPRMSLQAIIPTCLRSASFSLFITFVIDSFFWKRPIWPEMTGFYFNVILGRSSDWGTFPVYYYYSHLLPKILLNPVILFVLIPFGLKTPVTKSHPHKELRFIIYVTVPLTAAASCSATYLWNHSSKKVLYRLASLILVASILCSGLISTGMLLISSLNYPGGHAISQLNHFITNNDTRSFEIQDFPHQISIHLDVLSCMTGVSRFLEISSKDTTTEALPVTNTPSTILIYDKTEDEKLLHQPSWWKQFDYALMERPELALGEWDLIATIPGYSSLKILRPGEFDSSFLNYVEEAILTTQKELENQIDCQNPVVIFDVSCIFDRGTMKKLLLKAKVRGLILVKLITIGQWHTSWSWVTPSMEPKIRILKRQMR